MERLLPSAAAHIGDVRASRSLVKEAPRQLQARYWSLFLATYLGCAHVAGVEARCLAFDNVPIISYVSLSA